MNKYITKSGQNIYDIALTIYGSIEGIFDLLISNPNISLETVFTKGVELAYHYDFVLNKDVTNWLKDNKVLVKNGNYKIKSVDIKSTIKTWIKKQNSQKFIMNPEIAINPRLQASEESSGGDELTNSFDKWVLPSMIVLPSDEEEIETYYDNMSTPKIKIIQHGNNSTISMQVPANNFVAIDWGDGTDLEFLSYQQKITQVTHIYEDNGNHTIFIYGNNRFTNLDFIKINGIYYALTNIYISKQFITPYTNATILNQLFIIQSNE